MSVIFSGLVSCASSDVKSPVRYHVKSPVRSPVRFLQCVSEAMASLSDVVAHENVIA